MHFTAENFSTMKATGMPLQGTKVLVAEDDPILAFDIMRELMKAGADVVGPALSLARALELAEQENLSCGVLDVRLRDGLVFAAAEVLRKKGVGIVFYTGQVDIEELKRDWPASKVLRKPAPSSEITKAVVDMCP